MSTAPLPTSGMADMQQAMSGVMELGTAAASPFIKSASGKNTEQIVLAETKLFIAALPYLAEIFSKAGSGLGHLFHHAHQAHQAHQDAAAQQPAVQVKPAAAPAPGGASPVPVSTADSSTTFVAG